MKKLNTNIASRNQREQNLIFDGILFVAISFAIIKILSLPLGSPISQFISAIVTFFYYFLFELFFAKTPAKFLTQTKVVRKDRKKLDSNAVFIRSIVRLIPFEWISFCFAKHPIGLHDKFAQTIVISEKDEKISLQRIKLAKVIKTTLYILIIAIILLMILIPTILILVSMHTNPMQ